LNGSSLKDPFEKTTDREDAGDVVVVPAALGGEEKPEASPPEVPTPFVLDPEVAAVLSREFPDRADREELAARVPSWIALYRLVWIIRALAELAGRRRRAASQGKPIRSLADYAESILARWQAEGKATTRLAKPPPTQVPNVPSPEEDASARAEKRAANRSGEARRERWRALPEPEKAALMAEYEHANPPPAPGISRKLHELMQLAWCEETLEQRELAR
jgi:hypothetical protein